MESKEKRDILNGIIRSVYNVPDKEWDEKTVERFAREFEHYYKDGYYNLYSGTYQWMSDLKEGSASDYLDLRLSEIERYFAENIPEYKEKFVKLRDYVLLESARASNLSDQQRQVKEHLQSASEMLAKSRHLAEEFEVTRKESSAQTITLLSIFTGVAMAFFGGFSLLGSAFDNLEHGLTRALVLVTLLGFVLFNTVFVLLYVAAKISGHPLDHCSAQAQPCKECTCCGKFFGKRLWKKYPLACMVNTILLVLLALFIAAHSYLMFCL